MEKIQDLCQWLKETKGITKIDMTELVSYMPEYDEHLKEINKHGIKSR